MQKNNDEYKVFIDFLNAYNECFYEKDIEKLRITRSKGITVEGESLKIEF